MATTTDLEKLVINYLTQDQYDDAREAGTLNANELYLTPDTGSTSGTVTSVAVANGGALSVSGSPITTSGTITISHADTSSQSSVSNSGRTYIQSVTLDTYGHVTGLSSATETVTNSDEKLGTDAVTSGTTYYIVAGTNTTGAERKKYDASGIAYKATNGTVNGTNGEALLTLGNSTASTSANWKAGKIFLYSSSAYGGTLVPEAVTFSSKTWTLPNKTGTIALTSDIPTKTSDLTNDGNGTSNFATMADIGSLGGGTITKVKTTAGTHTTIDVSTGNAEFNVPTKTSHLTNDSGFVTSSGVTSIATTSPISGGTITSTGTISHATSGVGTAVTTAGFYKFKYDTYGHVTGVSAVQASDITGLVTIPTNTDENVKSTAVTAATTSYIVGSAASTTTTGGLLKHASAVLYTTADSGTSGYTQLRLGNTTATSSAGGKEGQIRLYGTNATYYLDLKPGAIASSNKTITFPNATGTVALTSDIPDVSGKIDTAGTGLSKSGTTLNHSNSVTAQTTQAVYPIKIDAQGHISAYGSAVTIPTDTNTTYALSGALSSHKFTSTLTAGGSGSGTSTSDFTLAAGTGITITDTTSSRTMTIACSVTNTDTKVTQAYSTTSNSYPLLMTATSGISSTSSRGDTTSILNNQIYANPSTGTITATAFSGAAAATTAYTTANLKNIVESTSDPDTASSYPTGTVWIKYTA